jgi:hypothetical protein
MGCSHPKYQNLTHNPWVMVCVDLVESFTTSASSKKHSLLALTTIDQAAGWLDIVEAKNKSATPIQDLFHNTWFARYPRLQFILFDNRNMGEFKREFKQMCEITIMALKQNQLQATASRSLANAIIERVHKVVVCQ